MATWEECNQAIEKIVPPKSETPSSSGKEIVVVEAIQSGGSTVLKNAKGVADAMDAIQADPAKALTYGFVLKSDNNTMVADAATALVGEDYVLVGMRFAGSDNLVTKEGERYTTAGLSFTRDDILPDGSVKK